MSQDQIMRQAQAAVQEGDSATARLLLRQVIEVDPDNEIAWLWLSALVDDPEQERDCLERVIAINPDNAVAQRHLQRLAKVAPVPSYLAAPASTPSYLAEPTRTPAAPTPVVVKTEPVGEPPAPDARSPSMLEMWGSGFTLSCISPTFYQHAAHSRVWGTVGFFILFALTLTLVQTLNVYRAFGTLGQEAETSLASGQFPQVTISGGRARLQGENPFVREFEDSIVILDTTGTYEASYLLSGRYDQGILLTSSTLYNLDDRELQSIDLGELQAVIGDPFVLNANTIQTLLNWLQIGIFIVLLLWNTLARLAVLALVALLVWGITTAIRPGTRFLSVFSVGTFALVPATYGTQLLTRARITFCGRQIVLWLVVWTVGLVAALSERKGGIMSGTRPLRAWRALIGIPMLLVLALDAIFTWQYGAGAAWLTTLLTLAALAAIGLWPIMGENQDQHPPAAL